MNRLNLTDWLDAGLVALAEQGFTSLKADILAKRLKVSRGSFYWHFKDVAAFHDQLLEHWVSKTIEVAAQLESFPTVSQKLKHLMQAAYVRNDGLEVAFRAWAQMAPNVSSAVHELDALRLAALTSVLADALNDEAEARRRAVVLYAAAIGLSNLESQDIVFVEQDFERLAGLFLGAVKQ